MKGKAHFQQTLASQPSFEKYSRKSRREEFLSLMETVVPWRELEAVIEPHYPKSGQAKPSGRSRYHAPRLLPAALVQLVGPRSGRRAVRVARAAQVCGG